MSNFIKNNLNTNEKLIKKVELNFINSFFPFLLLSFIGIGLVILFFIPDSVYQNIMPLNDINPETISYIKFSLLAIGVFLNIFAFLKYINLKSIVMLITNEKVLKKEGILNTNTQEIRLNAIETIEIKRSLIDRLTGSGNLIITGRGNAVIVFRNIDHPAEIKQLINQAISSNID